LIVGIRWETYLGSPVMGSAAVLISGVSGGIGSATADRFLAAGHDVLGIDLVTPATPREGLRVAIADVRSPDAVAAAVEELCAERPLDHLVSLAGRATPDELRLAELSIPAAAGAFSDSLQLNLTGQFTLLRAAVPSLHRAKGDRSITLCSSINALAGFGLPAYSAAKAGVIGLMHALAPELGEAGIRINTIAPGTTRTPLTEAEASAANDETRFERAGAETQLGRVAEADDIAAAIESLALRMTHVTDHLLEVDGGQLRSRG
jgi:NAD(P)-dependent dehydrogenase (short-subunit alcohol dehydrogenase family)